MKKLVIFSILFSSFFSVAAYAQDNEEQEEEKVEYMKPQTSLIKRSIVREKTPIEYAEITEENALSLQTIWRRIDCRERMNYHLYYPTEVMDNRMSLAQTLLNAVKRKKIKAYDDQEMKIELDISQILGKLDAKEEMKTQEKMDGSGDTVMIAKGEIKWGEIREYIVKEEWFIDKRHGRLDVRILAICPLRVFSRTEGIENKTDVCWFYFPEVRRVLANTICFTGKNQIANLSFDDIFHKRYFSSYIEKISNEVNDRSIRNYTRNGLEAILESEKVKKTLLEMESDLWSY